MSEVIDSRVIGSPNEVQHELQFESFRVIRHFVNDFSAEPNNDEIAGYVKGVCNLECELSKKIDGIVLEQLHKNLDKF